MNYLLLSLGSAVCLAIYDIAKKVSLKKSSTEEILFFYTLIAFIASFIFIKDAINTSLIGIGIVFIKSLIISVNWAITMKTMKKLDVGIVVPFGMMTTVFVTVSVYLFFGERVNLESILGIVLVLFGLIVLANLEKKDKKEKNDYKYILLLVFGAFLGAISGTLDKFVLSNGYATNRGLLFFFMLFLSLIYGIVYFIKNKKINFRVLKTNYPIIFIGLAIVASDLLYYSAVSIPDSKLALISIVRRLSLFISVIAASLLLKESNLFKKIIIFVIMFGGLALILLT